ncbi:hypothetical protein [Deinococcus sp.]|uniref:hypothetical protein n=1 Tax=Deinococcus sp. TaxID=47478 RepID=UPI0025C60BBA|nr:hypothetical protein [Deinococcus sp.]
MLEALARDLQGSPEQLRGAARRAFHLAFAALAVPGAVLGLLYALTQPPPYPLPGVAGLGVVALVLGGAALYLAKQSGRDPRLTATQAGLTCAMQLASAPAVAFLLGCAALRQWQALALLWGLALALYLYARTQLPQLVRPEPRSIATALPGKAAE